MEREEILGKLATPGLPFLEKLRLATVLEVDLWEDRKPPNLGENELRKLLKYIPANVRVTWGARDSFNGKHGKTGDDEVFKFEFSTKILGFETLYFVKGYFFDKGNCKGVCFQSFREEKRTKIQKPRLVRIK